MTLAPGTRVGPYEIVAAIGAGGMGEVYKARDTRLDRVVAVKVLPALFASDADFRERFEREARVISSLEHPHICPLYDVGEHQGMHFLVMQYLEGQTLADRLKAGPLPVDRTLRHAVEIAEALDAAHRQGVVHRDLKPGNVMLTKSGAKLLDFGLAKHATSSPAAGVTALPTVEAELTARGTILGTIQYMSPEQLEGGDASARTDIFAFGAVVYEMATGHKAFEGKSQASVIAAILERDPPPMATLQALTPRALERVVRQCLAKAPEDRWQSAHDLVTELKWIAEGALDQTSPVVASVPASRKHATLAAAAGLLVGLMAAGVGTWIALRGATDERAVHLAVPVDPIATLLPPGPRSPLAISPDGQHVVISAIRDGVRHLYLRSLYERSAQELPGTENADGPFFSPDGRWIGFSAAGVLKRVAIDGGGAQTVTSATDVRGAAWAPGDFIVFPAHFTTALSRIAAGGGAVEPLTKLDAARNEKSHRFPQVLPGGKAVLFTIGLTDIASFDDARIGVVALDTGQQKIVLPGGFFGRYVASGHLIYARGGALLAAPFSLERLEVTGASLPVVTGVAMSPLFGSAGFDVASNGTLAYLPASTIEPRDSLVSVDRAGKAEVLFEGAAQILTLEISPDGKRIALSVAGANDSVWLYDTTRKMTTRLSFRAGDTRGPTWSPDGRTVTYIITHPFGLASTPADGGGKEEILVESPNDINNADWSRDGKYLIHHEATPSGFGDLWVFSRESRKRDPFLVTRFNEVTPRFSPDGRWVAYMSNESGRNEVYVRPFPGPGGKWPISTDGGGNPRWSPDGREIFYRKGTAVMAVSVATGASFNAGVPRLLFDGGYLPGYDVMPDGRTFVMLARRQPTLPQHVNLVLNWFADLQQRVKR